MKIKTIHADSIIEFKRTYNSHKASEFNPNIAIIFASVDVDINELKCFFETEDIDVFGCSSCGEFVYNESSHDITEGSVVCMLMELLPDSYKLNLFNGDNITSFDLGSKVGNWTKEAYQNPGLLILASGLSTDGEALVRGIQHTTDDAIKMFGGLAGDDAKFKDTFVFSKDKVENNGTLAMALDLDVYEMQGLASSGWVGIGADKIVTSSEGNIVYTIDNQPALDVYKEYLNVSDNDLPEIGIEFPLLLKNKGREDVLRAVVNVDKVKKSLIFAGSVPQGSTVTFSSSPGFGIIELTKENINQFYNINKDADVLILFSCMARHNALGPTISDEIEDAWHKWNVPLIGFFTYGEIGNNFNSSCNFYNQTFTLVSLKKK